MPRGTPVPLNGKVLEWAIDTSGWSRHDLAKHLRIEESALKAWERNESAPNKTQFERIATALGRSTAVLLAPQKPSDVDVELALRAAPGASRRQLRPEERRSVRWAARQQRVAKALAPDSPELELPRLPLATPPESAAEAARTWVGVSVEQQVSWKDNYDAVRQWRAAYESKGVMTFQESLGRDGFRGFSLADSKHPAIAINAGYTPAARVFTLAHELGHLVSETSGVCLAPSNLVQGHDRSVEAWCESFAAAFLLPEGPLFEFLENRYNWFPERRLSDVPSARAVASHFHVSLRASAIRLIETGMAERSLTEAVNRLGIGDLPPDSSTGGGATRSENRMRRLGSRFVRTVSEAVVQGKISQIEAAKIFDLPLSDVGQFLERDTAP